MKIAIIYDSASGNTKAIAMAIQRAMEGQDVVYVGPPQAGIQAELYFIGSWTEKGMCTPAVPSCLKPLQNIPMTWTGKMPRNGLRRCYGKRLRRKTENFSCIPRKTVL